MKLRSLVLGWCLLAFSLGQAQDKAPDNWFNLDFQQDNVRGVSTEKMYKELLQNRAPQQTVVVAVIDSGVDAEHDDLQDVMWVNPGEIPGNGIDDDKNGYIDDVNGWNFIGGKDGNVGYDNLEVARLVKFYRDKFKGKNINDLSKKERKEYEKYQKLEEDVTEEQEKGKKGYEKYASIYESIEKLEAAFGGKPITAESLATFETNDEGISGAMALAGNVLEQGGTMEDLKNQLKGGMDYYESKFKYHYNPDFNPRTVVGDNYNDSSEKYYGNNDVEGPDAGHGTHVAGIIAAVRKNDVGMDGIASNVRIMSIRTVPDGDERDKDVANAIIYAVDNGASVVNMSFGKGYSWDKEAVDKAVKYAAKKDVLLVHAAGNSSLNTDVEANFPTDRYAKRGLFGPKKAKNWLEVGALSWKKGEDAPAKFSNYGKNNVDVFAPGVDIFSTVPNDEYASFSGTSMASPVTAGVAAVLRSYFPELSAPQVKEIIMKSTVPVDEKVKVPGSNKLVPFSDLSVTGGVVNVYKAVELASQTKGKKKNWKKSPQATAAGVMPGDSDLIRP